jgi:ssDNA-binding Zn-finger/Zn-ribbon topoisomerase 1
MSVEAEREQRIKEVKQAYEAGDCPKCGTELEFEGYHERDSTWDRHYCPKCDWQYTEIETWSINES